MSRCWQLARGLLTMSQGGREHYRTRHIQCAALSLSYEAASAAMGESTPLKLCLPSLYLKIPSLYASRLSFQHVSSGEHLEAIA